MSGKTCSFAGILINATITADLSWLKSIIPHSIGIWFVDSGLWYSPDADLVMWTDTTLKTALPYSWIYLSYPSSYQKCWEDWHFLSRACHHSLCHTSHHLIPSSSSSLASLNQQSGRCPCSQLSPHFRDHSQCSSSWNCWSHPQFWDWFASVTHWTFVQICYHIYFLMTTIADFLLTTSLLHSSKGADAAAMESVL